ncbi:MAG: hypothetical protein ACRYGP_13665 [Janthinobacterium lividum]
MIRSRQQQSIRLQLLAAFRIMERTGLQQHPDQERPIGAALAARLPKIIAAAVKPAKRGARCRRVSL